MAYLNNRALLWSHVAVIFRVSIVPFLVVGCQSRLIVAHALRPQQGDCQSLCRLTAMVSMLGQRHYGKNIDISLGKACGLCCACSYSAYPLHLCCLTCPNQHPFAASWPAYVLSSQSPFYF